jgi:hypothetical protein
MLKQVQHDGRGRYKISDVGGTKYRAWALQNIGRGRYKISCKSIGEESGDLGGLFFVAIGAAVHRRYTIFRPRYVRVYAPCQAKGLAGRTRLSREHS